MSPGDWILRIRAVKGGDFGDRIKKRRKKKELTSFFVSIPNVLKKKKDNSFDTNTIGVHIKAILKSTDAYNIWIPIIHGYYLYTFE